MFAKSDVNGKDQNPIYEFLKSRCPSVRAEFQASYKLYYEPYHQDDIRWATINPVLDEKHLEHFFTRWNFEKFLVNHEGQPVRRYDESLDPSELVSSFFHRWSYSVKVKAGSLNLFPSRRFQTSTFYWASASKTLHPRPSPTHIDTHIENPSLKKPPLIRP